MVSKNENVLISKLLGRDVISLNVDNTIYDFLDNMRDQFMNAIPETLATGVSKRNLIKNIKDLYGAKGTSKGHELFFKAFLGETPEIIYPTQYVMRSSDGNWGQKTTLRVTAAANVDGDEAVSYTHLRAHET